MNLVAQILAFLVGLLHFWFMVLEMFLWTKPAGMKAFRMTKDRAEMTQVLAANQGLYNAFLGAGLFWGLFRQDTGVVNFFLICVTVAGLYGGYSVSRKIVFIQAFPAALALTIGFFF